MDIQTDPLADTSVAEPQEEIVEAEVASDTPQQDTPANGGSILINMEAMIKNYMSTIDQLQEESKKLKGMLDDIFNNDPTYKDHADKAKEATQLKAKTRAEILKRPQAKDLNDKIKTMKSEVKENQEALSDYLQEYERMSGVNQIEDDQGNVRKIVYNARLVRAN